METYRWDALGTLIVTSLAIMGTPGPATISLTAAGSAYGVRRSLALPGRDHRRDDRRPARRRDRHHRRPPRRPRRTARPDRGGGRLHRSGSPTTSPPLPPLSAQGEDSAAPGLAGGALLGVANPKAWVAIAAVFASARLAGGAALDAAAKTAVLTVMIVFINSTWLAAGASLAPLLRDPRRARRINGALAAVLVAAAALTVFRP